ncbi:MAG: hypothetical protein ACYSUC_00085 [Planctomycetota bacterium]|jgi:hypothetical protein
MAKQRVGLHKEITSIFDGVPIVRNTGVQQAPPAPAEVPPPYEGGSKRGQERDERPVSPRPPAPVRKKPKMPEHRRPEQTLPKPAPVEQLEADTGTGSAARIPWQKTLEQIKNKLFASKEGVSVGRQKILAILVPVLSIVLIFVLIRVLLPSAGKTEVTTELGPLNTAAGSEGKVSWQAPEPYPTTLRDPMRFNSVTTDQPETGTSELQVRGIVHSKDRPSAIVGSKIVHEGDQVSGATVIRINKDSVEFEKNGKKWIQKVH